MVVKSTLPPIEQIRKILADQHGTLLTSDLARFNIPRTYLALLEQNGEIEWASRGVYRATAAVADELFSFQGSYKSSIYSHETALFLHDLTDRTPLSFSVTVPTGYHSIALNQSGHKVFYINRKLFELGVTTMKSPHGNPIRVTDLERTLCDVVRSRHQMDVQFVNEALKRYVGRKGKNLDLLYGYARRFKIQKVVRNYIEVLL